MIVVVEEAMVGCLRGEWLEINVNARCKEDRRYESQQFRAKSRSSTRNSPPTCLPTSRPSYKYLCHIKRTKQIAVAPGSTLTFSNRYTSPRSAAAGTGTQVEQ